MKPKLIIFSAPSGAGKTTIVKEVLKTDIPFAFSVSATSRKPREGEVHTKDYHFLSVNDFKESIEKEHFLEWEEVYENQYYGTLKSEVESKRQQGYNVIFDVDVVGGLNIKKYYGEEALAIFIMPPSIEELKKRLQGRGTETEESFNKRIAKAEHEMTFAKDFDVVIVNDDLQKAVQETIDKIRNFINN
ncbi:MAG: guanylate kinase [Bacteroidetes bacterium]|nr:MAG: guanylate kinase [Bacteroidota bacterium]